MIRERIGNSLVSINPSKAAFFEVIKLAKIPTSNLEKLKIPDNFFVITTQKDFPTITQSVVQKACFLPPQNTLAYLIDWDNGIRPQHINYLFPWNFKPGFVPKSRVDILNSLQENSQIAPAIVTDQAFGSNGRKGHQIAYWASKRGTKYPIFPQVIYDSCVKCFGGDMPRDFFWHRNKGQKRSATKVASWLAKDISNLSEVVSIGDGFSDILHSLWICQSLQEHYSLTPNFTTIWMQNHS